jgi:prepilin-type N-terminal cleavage/methylation domain-containing protein
MLPNDYFGLRFPSKEGAMRGYSSPRRRGLTLIELLITVAIVAVLLALCLVAVHRIRNAANLTQSKNNLKNIVMATHSLADTSGRLPVAPVSRLNANGALMAIKPSKSVFHSILPFIEQSAFRQGGQYQGPFGHIIPLFLSPGDPTVDEAVSKKLAVTSYAANALVFRDGLPIASTFADGSSNTVAFAEHYAHNCHGYSFYYLNNQMPIYHYRRATFADVGDEVPITSGSPPVSTSADGLTFQVAPTLANCNSRIAQSPYYGGLPVAMGDGGVRTLAPSMSAPTYWALITPAAGDTPDGDW